MEKEAYVEENDDCSKTRENTDKKEALNENKPSEN